MKHIYYLHANSLREIRTQIKLLKTQIKEYTSSYQYNSKYYIFIIFANELNSKELQNYHLVKGQHYQSPINGLDLLINWGLSELEQDMQYLHYENQAQMTSNGCFLEYQNQKIIRSFRPLTETMYIVNNTPDSFSEQGETFLQIDKILHAIQTNLEYGASIIDIGAESTRPNAIALDTTTEIQRLQILITETNKLKKYFNFKLSLDSYKPTTIKHFLNQIDIINDVSGNQEPQLLKEIAQQQKIYLPMHSLTIPAQQNINLDASDNPLEVLLSWGKNKLNQLKELGFNSSQIILDIGIGFNKTPSQTWFLLKNIAQFHQLECQLLIGHSRKSFLRKITTKDAKERDLETAVSANYLASQLVDYLRLHNLEEFYRVSNTTNQLSKNTF